MKYLAAYIIFIAIASALGLHWFQAAIYPWFVIFIYGLFYTAFKPASRDNINIVFGIIALLAALPCAANFGKATRNPIDELIPISSEAH